MHDRRIFLGAAFARRAAVAVLFLAGCSAQPTESTESSASRIIGGIDSGAEQDETILLVARLADRSERCTGTLLAPNLVLTARHCVSQIAGNAASCSPTGIGADFSPEQLHAFVGNESPGDLRVAATFEKAAAKGKKIYRDDSTNLCGHDIALVLLDRAIENAKIAPVRFNHERTVAGEKLTAIGWGVTESTTSTATEPAVRKQRKGITIGDVGPKPDKRPQLADQDFQVGESICSGDSGGPAVSEATRAVIGVVSRGGNGRPGPSLASECMGSDTINIYTQTAPFKDLILAAHAEAGYPAWAEGEPDPRKAKFGAACQRGDDCQSAVCYENKCSLDCLTTECPAGYQCLVDGSNKICKIPPIARGTDAGTIADPHGSGTTLGGGQCGVSPGSRGAGFGLAALGLLALCGIRRARRR